MSLNKFIIALLVSNLEQLENLKCSLLIFSTNWVPSSCLMLILHLSKIWAALIYCFSQISAQYFMTFSKFHLSLTSVGAAMTSAGGIQAALRHIFMVRWLSVWCSYSQYKHFAWYLLNSNTKIYNRMIFNWLIKMRMLSDQSTMATSSSSDVVATAASSTASLFSNPSSGRNLSNVLRGLKRIIAFKGKVMIVVNIRMMMIIMIIKIIFITVIV